MNASDPQSSAVEVISLTKKYPGVLAVDGINFTIERGTIVGLLGPNGAGKTTTLRMLAGILKPTSGSIIVQGYDIANDLIEVKKRIGFLSGDTRLYQRLTVREILRFFGKLNDMPADRLESRIEMLVSDFQMSAFVDRKIATLSSGQTQRANIARTVLHDPDVLILDEITASLDIISSQFIIESLKELKARNKAILFSTHIMSEAEYLCDQIKLIHGGRIIDSGTTQEILEKSGSDNLTTAFLAHIHNNDETISESI